MANVSLINIGINGLRAHQLALGATGQNITNASTEGYSRQRVEIATQRAGTTGLFSGAGVRVDSVSRIADDDLSQQIRLDTAAFSGLDTLASEISRLDGLLASDASSLDPALNSFFASLQGAASEPSSIPARQLVLSEAENVSNRFRSLAARMASQARAVDSRLGQSAVEINELARSVADINQRISVSRDQLERGGINDLLDRRDEILRRLAGLVGVRTLKQDNGELNVFIGKGQPLIVGSIANVLRVDEHGEVLIRTGGGGVEQTITSSVTGGELGGLLQFREGLVSEAQSRLGRIALVLAQTVNEAHAAGVDLSGRFGGEFFSNPNETILTRERVGGVGEGANLGNLAVFVDDARSLTDSNYELSFVDNETYVVRRLNDGAVVFQGDFDGRVPQEISFDSLTLRFEGGELGAGDRYLIRPAAGAAANLRVGIEEVQDLAFGAPIRTSSDLGNTGTGRLQVDDVFDLSHPIFQGGADALLPPLLIRFTSDTTYDVLDNSDPARPQSLVPPLEGLDYVPGSARGLLPGSFGQTLVESQGQNAGALPAFATVVLGPTANANALAAETLTFRNADSSVVGQVDLPAGTSASLAAARLSAIEGVSAFAASELTLSQISDNGIGTPMAVALNGFRFSIGGLNPLNDLADAINATESFGGDIVASSDGDRILLRSLSGADLSVFVSGDPTDSLTVTDPRGTELTLNGVGPGTAALLEGTTDVSTGFNFAAGGPYDFSLSVDGEPAVTISLNQSFADGNQLVQGLRDAIDASAIGPGRLNVGLSASGGLLLTAVEPGADRSITVAGVQAGGVIENALGIGNGGAVGEDRYRTATVSGSVTMVLDDGVAVTSDTTQAGGNLFTPAPVGVRADFGFQLKLSGSPRAADEFSVEFNRGGVSDNRNALAMAALQTVGMIGESDLTFSESYSSLVERIGIEASQSGINRDAAEALLEQSTVERDALSGVNLDEEAANLLRFEQGYNASAQVIGVARQLLDVLFNLVN